MTERFELLSQLGKGGMGTVWKARDAETGEVVALKLLHEMYVDDADYVARFEREVDIARKIDSPHVVKVFGYGKRDGTPYVAMEYVEGPSLRERLRDGGPMDWPEAKRLATQMAQALAAAHAAGVIHRDVKPSNVLIDPSGNVKLADFGIARAADLTRVTGSVTVLGTPAYMSPDGEANEQSDLYGLGCVLYEMLTGSPPFVGESQQQVILKHIRETPGLEKLPAEARPIVGWLLEKEAKDRPGNAEALVAVLEGSTKRPLPGPMALTGGRFRRRKTVALVGAFGLPVVVLAGLGIFLAASGGRGAPEKGDNAGAIVLTVTASPISPSPPSSISATEPSATATATGTPSATGTFETTPNPTATSTARPLPTMTPINTPTSTPTPTSAVIPTVQPEWSFNATGGELTRISQFEWLLTFDYQYNGYAGPIVKAYSYYGFQQCTDAGGGSAYTFADHLFNYANQSTLPQGSGVAEVRFRMSGIYGQGGNADGVPFPVTCSNVWVDIVRENGNQEHHWKLAVSPQVFTGPEYE